jgi:hypothetical protein
MLSKAGLVFGISVNGFCENAESAAIAVPVKKSETMKRKCGIRIGGKDHQSTEEQE